MLRWDPPSHYQGRWVEKDVTLHGVTIPAESRVILLTGSANHDERVFAEPELFDLHRRSTGTSGSGSGSICAWGRPWPGSRRGSRSKSSSAATRSTSSSNR